MEEGLIFLSWNHFWDRGFRILPAIWRGCYYQKTENIKRLHDSDLGTIICHIFSSSPKLNSTHTQSSFIVHILGLSHTQNNFYEKDIIIYQGTQLVFIAPTSRTERLQFINLTQELNNKFQEWIHGQKFTWLAWGRTNPTLYNLTYLERTMFLAIFLKSWMTSWKLSRFSSWSFT